MTTLTMYGASDNLVEFEGAVVDEFDVDRKGAWDGVLTSPDGQQLIVHAQFGSSGWQLSVSNMPDTKATDWPIHFGDRPDTGQDEVDPAIIFEVPAGTTITPLTEPDVD